MAVTITLDTKKLEQIMQNAPRMVEDALTAIAEEVVSDIKLSMVNSPADGDPYRRRGVVHVASSAGNAPRPDTGALLGSIRQRNAGKLTRVVEDGVEYGYYLETVLDRPWMRPVLEQYAMGKMGMMLKQMLEI